jgi:hypothetical protein
MLSFVAIPSLRLATLLGASLVAGAVASEISAQDAAAPARETATAPVRFFGSLGIGAGTEGLAGLASLSLRTGLGDFTARFSGSSDGVQLFRPSDDVSDAALLYGRTREGDSGWIRLSAGPAVVERQQVGVPTTCVLFFCDYDVERTSTFGLALQVDSGTAPTRRLGIGLSGFASVNSLGSFAGVAVSLHIGRVGRRSPG